MMNPTTLSILALMFFAPTLAQSDTKLSDSKTQKQTICEPGDELIDTSKANRLLVACGMKHAEKLIKLIVYQADLDPKKEIFSGNEAFKSYKLRRSKEGFEIEEALSARRKEFNPFLEIHVTCDKTQCHAKDAKCIWKKSDHSKPASELIQSLKDDHDGRADSILTDLFYSALNGDSDAQKFFFNPKQFLAPVEGSQIFDGAAGETYETHASDLKRMKKLGCVH